MQYDIYVSSSHVSGHEMKYIQRAFDENKLATFGSNIGDFEVALQRTMQSVKPVLAVNSGTSAIHLALILLGIKPGDEVICQSLTFCASANPVLYLGATPIFIDSERETWNLCPKLLRKAIEDRIAEGKKPKAIIGVHLYGMPFKADEILGIAEEYGIPLIEDAAEALGSTYKNQACGTFGDFGIFSFNGNKIITTAGGGALVCGSEEIKKRALYLATQAKHDEAFYHHTEIGYNYRMTNLAAAIGLGQMEVFEEYAKTRRYNLDFYKKILDGKKGFKIMDAPSNDFVSNCWLNQIIIDKEIIELSPSDLKMRLKNYRIETKLIWKPLHLQPVFRDYPFYTEDNVAEELFNSALSLPSGSNMRAEDYQKIEAALNEIL